MRYPIYEGNLERLRKKMARIQNKCRKYNTDFRYEEVGEEFRKLKDYDGTFYMARFVIVEAEGVAIVNGWRFAATVEHTEKGNIIRAVCNIEVPDRYYTSDPICEHCNSHRRRKDTYIVMNEDTGDFKQVGKSCLADFTHGMSAEAVAQYTAAFEELIRGETPSEGSRITRYIKTEVFLRYIAETIRHFGYTKYDPYGTRISTFQRADRYYTVNNGGFRLDEETRQRILSEMESCGFDAESAEAKKETSAALEWLKQQSETNTYMHNLKTACSLEYVTGKHFGIIASLFPAYNRELEREAERQRAAKAAKVSQWIGNVGERIEIHVESAACVTSWQTRFGCTRVYKFIDDAGNIYTWKTGVYLEEVSTIKGTVKAHNEFRGAKQTELTRCRCSA